MPENWLKPLARKLFRWYLSKFPLRDGKAFLYVHLHAGLSPLDRFVAVRLDKGFTMRVYVPFGKDWFNYSIRRLKENPRMITHMIKALFFRG